MIIQRLQTLFLLVAFVLMCGFTFAVPAADVNNAPLMVHEFTVWTILNCLIAILLFLAIFMFKNLKKQMTVTLVSVVLLCASLVTGIFCIKGYAPEAAAEIRLGSVAILCAVIIFAMLAYQRMRHDLKVLRSYDRLR